MSYRLGNEPTPSNRIWAAFVIGLQWLTIVLFALLTLDVLWGVVSRYVVGSQSRWTEEFAIYALVWVSLLGATLMFRERGHLGVDYFVGKLDPAARRLSAVIAEVAIMVFAAFVLVYGGGKLVIETLRSGQVTPAMGWKVGYINVVVPLSGLFIIAFSIEHLISGRTTASADEIGKEIL
ncbi:TRAP transporter small permease [Synoicihabitans lomoniglobus]|uniref:TRAP transporter small permease n=1 Tax=Synoicihabitans lomoniglobus TaxID=2909285 RepID=A0AAE9ZUH8_9BACT|nr:TRAP transporter small permease [Opitutaceae bacterium LMO-M01]WED63279.1 TRAP transporter small permease [Opitutaceae bacterium LMO-M01]